MKLTIITVVYNSLDMLRKTYQCLSHQSFQDYVWVIKDNYSTDGTAEFVQQIKNEFKNLVFINSKDDGIYNAMNQALDMHMIQDGLVTFLNAGDIYSNNDTLLQIIRSSDLSKIIIAIPVMVDHKIIHQNLLQDNKLYNICHQATFYNFSNILLKNKLRFDESISLCADFKILLDLYFVGDIQYLTNVHPVIYDSTGISSLKSNKRLWEKMKVVLYSNFSFPIKFKTSISIIIGLIRNVLNSHFIKQRK